MSASSACRSIPAPRTVPARASGRGRSVPKAASSVPTTWRRGAAPFDSLSIADIGDVAINTFDLQKSIGIIEDAYDEILSHGCKPLTLGGDHTIALPILRAMHRKHGPLGLVHVDAHADVNDSMFGEKIAHGTPFRRCVDEGLLDGKRVVQIGLRATGYAADDFDWPRRQGFRVVQAEECWHRSLTPLMAEVREQVGGGPVYISFDIDGLDPSYAGGTGTPEIAGLTTPQAVEIIRGCRGLDIIGGDLVEVSPPYDPSGNTALTAANLLFEMLCVFPGVQYRA
jgi:guanidinobutyrase